MVTTVLAADMLKTSGEMILHTLDDFTDAEMLVRPCPTANHTAWMLGHLIHSETHMVGSMSGAAAALPGAFEKKFTKETAGQNEPGFFPSKSPLLEQFKKTRGATVAWVRSLKDTDLDKPGPQEMRQFAPTVGHVVLMMAMHDGMHMGQMQVVRRCLGRPVMF